MLINVKKLRNLLLLIDFLAKTRNETKTKNLKLESN